MGGCDGSHNMVAYHQTITMKCGQLQNTVSPRLATTIHSSEMVTEQNDR